MNKFLTMTLMAGASFLGAKTAAAQQAPNISPDLAEIETYCSAQPNGDDMAVVNFHFLADPAQKKTEHLTIVYNDANKNKIFGDTRDNALITFWPVALHSSKFAVMHSLMGSYITDKDHIFLQNAEDTLRLKNGQKEFLARYKSDARAKKEINTLFGVNLQKKEIDYARTLPFNLGDAAWVTKDSTIYNPENHLMQTESSEYMAAFLLEDSNGDDKFGHWNDKTLALLFKDNKGVVTYVDLQKGTYQAATNSDDPRLGDLTDKDAKSKLGLKPSAYSKDYIVGVLDVLKLKFK